MDQYAKFITKTLNNPDDYLCGWPVMGVGAKPIDEQIAFLNEYGVDRIQLDFNTLYGWSPRDLSFLDLFPKVRAVSVGGNFTDSFPLEQLTNLVSFRDNAAARPDFSFQSVHGVSDLRVDYEKAHPKYEKFTNASHLNVARIPKRFSTLGDFPGVKLSNLSVASSPLQSLEGIEKFPDLDRILIHMCRKFTGEPKLTEHRGVRQVHLQYCPNLGNLDFLQFFPNLEHLELVNCGILPDFEVLRGMKNFRKLGGINTHTERKMSQDLKSSLPHLEFVSGHYDEDYQAFDG